MKSGRRDSRVGFGSLTSGVAMLALAALAGCAGGTGGPTAPGRTMLDVEGDFPSIGGPYDPAYFSIEVRGASDEQVIEALALEVGNLWVHRHRHREPGVLTVEPPPTQAITVIGHRRTPHGLIVLRRATRRVIYDSVPHYLLREGYVHEVPAAAWDEEKRQLSELFVAKLRIATPAYFFPMKDGIRWRARRLEEQDQAVLRTGLEGEEAAEPPDAVHGYCIVEGTETLETPAGSFEATRLRMRTERVTRTRWLAPKVGLVRETYASRDPPLERDIELVEFQRAF